MITILHVDDDKHFLTLLTKQLRDVVTQSAFCDYTYDIIALHDPEQAMEFCLKHTVQIALLDIDMPVVNGFDLAMLLNQKNEHIKLIFISNHDNMVYRSLAFRPFRFIRKSHIITELHEAVCAAINDLVTEKQFIDLGSKYFNQQLYLKDILYIESQKNYVQINTLTGSYIYRNTISQLVEKWSRFDFSRIHAGFLVNLCKVRKIVGEYAELENGVTLKISRKYKDSFKTEYYNFLRK